MKRVTLVDASPCREGHISYKSVTCRIDRWHHRSAFKIKMAAPVGVGASPSVHLVDELESTFQVTTLANDYL